MNRRCGSTILCPHGHFDIQDLKLRHNNLQISTNLWWMFSTPTKRGGDKVGKKGHREMVNYPCMATYR